MRHAGLLPLGELGDEQGVLVLVAAAGKQVGRGQFPAGRQLGRALGQEAMEGRDAGAGAGEHEGGALGLRRQVELGRRLDGDVQSVVRAQTGEVVGRHAQVGAAWASRGTARRARSR